MCFPIVRGTQVEQGISTNTASPLEAHQQGSRKKESSVKQRGQIAVLFSVALLALMLVALFGPLNVHAASGARVRPISVPAHFTTLPRFLKNTTTQSSNWSGYATDSGTYTSVSSSWVVPSVSCNNGTTYSSFWVGLDGYNSNSVEQTGTESDCSGSSPSTMPGTKCIQLIPSTLVIPSVLVTPYRQASQ
jgi:hypothetical protein